jgi:hypothetical protein
LTISRWALATTGLRIFIKALLNAGIQHPLPPNSPRLFFQFRIALSLLEIVWRARGDERGVLTGGAGIASDGR